MNRKPYPLFVLLLALLLNGLGVCGQIITTVAGNGLSGVYAGENIPATSATLNTVGAVVFDRAGYFYFAERLNNRVNKVSPDGIITTAAGNGVAGFSGDNGPATSAQLNNPTGVAIDTLGNVYIADISNYRVRKINAQTGIITTVVGNGGSTSLGDGGPATNASLTGAENVYFSASGDLFVLDFGAKIRKVNSAGIIKTVAGNGLSGYSGDGGPATKAQINPTAIATDIEGNLFIADWGNARVRKVSATTSIITTVAGTGIASYIGDGLSCLTANIAPFDIKFDDYGNLFIADKNNNRIRRVDASGIITTVAGTGNSGFSGDNGLATFAKIYGPEGVCFDSCGNIYIADCQNRRIRKITYPHCHYLEVENENRPSENLSIYPNPVNSLLHIDNLQTPATYRLLSIIGAVVQLGNLKEGNNSISVAAIPAGVYIIEVSGAENGERWVRRVVKE